VETRRRSGHSDRVAWVVAGWPKPLAQVGVLGHLHCGVAPAHCSHITHWVGGSRCCCHHLQAQIDILTLSIFTAAIKCLRDISINNRQSMTTSLKYVIVVVQMSTTQLLTAIKCYLPGALIHYMEPFTFSLSFYDIWQISI